MSDGDLGTATRRGLVWASASWALTKGSTFVSVLVLARLLTPGEFGVVAAIAAFLAVMELISDLGMKAAVVFEQEEGITPRVRAAATINLALAALLALIAVALAPTIAGFFRVEEETWLFRLAALNLLLVGLANIQDAVLLRGLDFRRRTRAELARGLTRGSVSIALAVAGFGPEALVGGMLAGSCAWAVVLWVMIPLRPALRIPRGSTHGLLGYGGPAVLLELVGAIGTRLDIAVVGHTLGERALGFYTVALRVPELLLQNVAWIISKVAFPALSRQRQIEPVAVAATSLRFTYFQGLYAFPLATGLAVLATPLVVVLFSATWKDTAGVVVAVSLMMALDVAVIPIGDALKATGQQWVLLAINVAYLPVMVIAMVLAAGEGITAVAWVRVGLQLLHAISVGVAAGRLLSLTFRGLASALTPAVLASAGVALGAGIVRSLWPAPTVGPLLLGSFAGAVGGAVIIRLFAPEAYREVARQLRAMAWLGRAAPSTPSSRSG